MFKKGKVNCDTRVEPAMKKRLEEIAKERGVKRADICRAAFQLYIDDFNKVENWRPEDEK